MSYADEARERVRELKARGHAVILAVESSCDETAMALVADGRRVLSGEIASQVDTHAPHFMHFFSSMTKGDLIWPDIAPTGQPLAQREQPRQSSGSI